MRTKITEQSDQQWGKPRWGTTTLMTKAVPRHDYPQRLWHCNLPRNEPGLNRTNWTMEHNGSTTKNEIPIAEHNQYWPRSFEKYGSGNSIPNQNQHTKEIKNNYKHNKKPNDLANWKLSCPQQHRPKQKKTLSRTHTSHPTHWTTPPTTATQ